MNEQPPPKADQEYPDNKPLISPNREGSETDPHGRSASWEAYSLPILAALLDP